MEIKIMIEMTTPVIKFMALNNTVPHIINSKVAKPEDKLAVVLAILRGDLSYEYYRDLSRQQLTDISSCLSELILSSEYSIAPEKYIEHAKEYIMNLYWGEKVSDLCWYIVTSWLSSNVPEEFVNDLEKLKKEYEFEYSFNNGYSKFILPNKKTVRLRPNHKW